MAQSKGALRWAANFAALSAVLHILALLVSGFSSEAARLLPFGILYGGFAYGLLRGWRWLGYVAFIVLLLGASLAISNVWANGDVPVWLYISIAFANLASVAALFAALWTTPQKVD